MMCAMACVREERSFSEELPVDGLAGVVATIQHGAFAYRGTSEERVRIDGTSIGRGRTSEIAKAHEQSNRTDIDLEDAEVFVRTWSDVRSNEVELDVEGPRALSMDVEVIRGGIVLDDVSGDVQLTGDRVVVRGRSGAVDVFSRVGGIEMDLAPTELGRVILESSAGPVVLGLPRGLPLDLQVIGDPSYPMNVANLGFDSIGASPGTFWAVSGEGDLRISVFVRGGGFELREVLCVDERTCPSSGSW